MKKFTMLLLLASALVCSGMKVTNADIIPTATFYIDVDRSWLKYDDEWVTNPDEKVINFTISVKIEDVDPSANYSVSSDLCLGLVFSSRDKSPVLGSLMGYGDSFEIWDNTTGSNDWLLFEGEFTSGVGIVCSGSDTEDGLGVLILDTANSDAIDIRSIRYRKSRLVRSILVRIT